MTDRIAEFTNAGFTFPVTDTGPVGGELVILLHGFPQTATSWIPVCELLNASGYRTLTFDQRGYTPTARPKGRFAYRVGALVSDVVALIDTVGGPVHLVGHDWGAMVAWATAARHPARLRTLTAVSVPHPRAFLRSMLSSTQAVKSYYMAMFQIPWLPETMLSRYPKVTDRLFGNTGMTVDMMSQLRDDVVAPGALGPALSWYRAIPFNRPAYLKKVSVPTAYVWSTHDVALGRRCAELCERYVTGPYRFEVTDGSHWIPEEEPTLVHDVIVDRIKGDVLGFGDEGAGGQGRRTS